MVFAKMSLLKVAGRRGLPLNDLHLITAISSDIVNNASALKEADIGIALCTKCNNPD